MSDVRTIVGTEANPNWPGSAIRAAVVERTRVKAAVEINGRGVLLRNPLSARAASFRVLRHRLARRGNPKVILVTSAQDEEGKTTCALNLALVLAESGRNRVLLLEANTRRPDLTNLLGFATPACFLDQLTQHRNETARPWIAAQVTLHDLDVMAVQPRPEARPAMHGPSLVTAVASLRQAYDYVVIDTSSILTGLDVPLLEDAADGILVAVRARRTRGRNLMAALDQLGAARLLGVALIDT